MDNFEVTFTETTKYNPCTRTVTVKTIDSDSAKVIVLNEFGKKRVVIDKVKKLKEA